MFERRHQAPVHDSPILLGNTGRCSGNLVGGKTGKTTPVEARPSEQSLSPALVQGAPGCRPSASDIASGTLGIVAMADNPIRLILTLGFACAEIVNIRRSNVEIRSLSAACTHSRTRSELQHRKDSQNSPPICVVGGVAMWKTRSRRLHPAHGWRRRMGFTGGWMSMVGDDEVPGLPASSGWACCSERCGRRASVPLWAAPSASPRAVRISAKRPLRCLRSGSASPACCWPSPTARWRR